MAAERRSILVVEDEPGAATLQRRRLERAGYRVVVAEEFATAIEILGREHVDLVVVDYRLGATTGLDLHRRMKAAGYDTPVVIVSGALDDATIVEAIRAGIKDVVVKNVDYLERLPETVRAVLSQAAVVPEARLTEQKTRVLIVEDDRGVATLERRQLERAGYEVEIAESPQQATERVRSGSINLALLDLRLGDSASGLDLYEHWTREGWNLAAILVTGYPDQAVAIRALRAGVRDLISKSSEYLEYLPVSVDRVMAQVRLEHRLVESELRLASIVGTAMDAILMCESDTHIVLFNRSAEEMFGYVAAEIAGRSLSTLFPDLHLAAAEVESGTGGLQRRIEVEAVRAGGDRIPVELSISDVVVHGSRLFTVIARDISERRRTEQELREADRRKDEFLGMLAHELRNPLAAITTAGEVLEQTVGAPGAQKLTNVIRRQTAALSRMVDDLLDVSRVTMGKFQLARERLLIGEVVQRAVDGVRTGADKAGVHLSADIAAEPLWVDADNTRLDQVLANLLNNAIKFTPAGGRVSVRVRREGDQVVVRVRDTGVGIEPDLLPKVFELFVQGDTSLDRSKSGLGIGLALVRQVVSLHGGRVIAESAGPGQGSEFTVILPPASSPAGAVGTGGGALQRVKGPVTVLVVDDQPDLADCFALLIEALGHRARALYDAREALSRLQTERPDLVLVDIGMPGMNGYEFARHVRADPALRTLRLIAITGYGRDEDRIRVMEAGFDLHLTKPLSETTLLALLEGREIPPRTHI